MRSGQPSVPGSLHKHQANRQSIPTRCDAMVNQPAKGSDRIKTLAREIANSRTKRGRELTEEEVQEKREEKAELEARREKVKAAAKAKRQLEAKMTSETDRNIASTRAEVRQGTATLEKRFDRLEAMVSSYASSSSGRDDLLQRLAGKPGSSQEMHAEILVRKEDMKRKRKEERKEEREEEKQAEKRRKLEQCLEIPLEEGDALQDGVVLRGELGRQKMRGLQAVRGFHYGRLLCSLLEVGETCTLELDPLNEEQLKKLCSMTQTAVEGTIRTGLWRRRS